MNSGSRRLQGLWTGREMQVFRRPRRTQNDAFWGSRYAEPMISRRILLSILVSILWAARMALAQVAHDPVALTPRQVVAGSPELIRVSAPGATAIDGEWLGRKISFFADHGAWVALAG